MPKNIINCKNLQCPEPVINVKRLIEASAPEQLTVIVDNEPALENVSRFLTSKNYLVSVRTESGLWHVTGLRNNDVRPSSDTSTFQPADSQAISVAPVAQELLPQSHLSGEEQKILVIIASPGIGSGDDTLGRKLMKNFLATLPEMGEALWRIVMVNGGVTLAVTGSPVLEHLQKLEQAGVSVLVCGTCLEHFNVFAQKAVGQTTNMLDIVTSAQLAGKVLRV